MKIVCSKVFLPSWVADENFVFKCIGLGINDFVVIFKLFIVLDTNYNHAIHCMKYVHNHLSGLLNLKKGFIFSMYRLET